MKYFLSICILVVMAVIVLLSCAKYKDVKAKTDPALTNPYCNDPNAVNYNWGFPGKPDSTVCLYPTDLFKGVYLYHDSISLTASGLFIYADSIVITITPINKSQMTLSGFCGGTTFAMTANVQFTATLDTLQGDSITTEGQYFCSVGDTVNGTITRDRINDSLIYFAFQVSSDTGVVSTHAGTARRIQ